MIHTEWAGCLQGRRFVKQECALCSAHRCRAAWGQCVCVGCQVLTLWPGCGMQLIVTFANFSGTHGPLPSTKKEATLGLSVTEHSEGTWLFKNTSEGLQVKPSKNPEPLAWRTGPDAPHVAGSSSSPSGHCAVLVRRRKAGCQQASLTDASG